MTLERTWQESKRKHILKWKIASTISNALKKIVIVKDFSSAVPVIFTSRGLKRHTIIITLLPP